MIVRLMLKKVIISCLLASATAFVSYATSLSEMEALYRAGNISETISAATDVVLEAETSRDTVSLIKAWSILGMCYAERGDIHNVAEYTQLLSDVLDDAQEDFHFVTSALYSSARIYRRSGQPQEALKYLNMAIAYESQLNRPRVLVRRYIELAEVYGDMGKWDKALDISDTALKYYLKLPERNGFVLSTVYYEKGVCEQKLGNDDAALSSFRMALKSHLTTAESEYKFSPECYVRLAEYAVKQDKPDSAFFYYDKALKSSKTMKNLALEREALLGMSGIEEDEVKAAEYARRADSLSFCSYVSEFAAKSASSLVDFPRKEQSQRIKAQMTVVVTMAVVMVLILLLTVSLIYNVRYFRSQAKLEAERNAALAESNLQKDRLLAIASAAVEEKERDEIKKLAKTMGNTEEIKLTKREREVAKYASEGLQNKEIADLLGINTRTVEAHRNSLYRKLGINNAIELSNYMNRVKYMSEKDS